MTTKYFSGEIELTRVRALSNVDFSKQFPGIKGRKYDGYSMQVGSPLGHASVYLAGQGWNHGPLYAVERIINYKAAPSLHECDARCMNATGKTMNCECSCGGKNHGRGGFICRAA